MIDITKSQPLVVQTRQRMHKKFDIDVTIEKETHNLEIDIYHNEDLDGKDAELDFIKIDINQFDSITDGSDMANDISVYLEDWFDKVFPQEGEEAEKDFNDIFDEVWSYIAEKDLY